MRKLAASLCFSLATLPAVAAPDYTMTVVADLGSYNVQGMNNSGIGIGYDYGINAPLMFSRDGITAMPIALPGQHTPRAINDANTFVGTTTFDSWHYRAFVMRDGVYRDIGGSQDLLSTARDINNAETVLVNYVRTDRKGDVNGSYIVNADGSTVDLGMLGSNGDTYGIAINDQGQVAGVTRDTDERFVPFLWKNGTMTTLGGLVRGEFSNNISGISELGHVLGTETDWFGSRAWVIKDGGIEHYDYLSRIFHIDSAGRIYGRDHNFNAVIVEGDTITRIADLVDGAPGLTFGVDAINEHGEILTARCINGDCDSLVMLTPVPEPSTYAMLLLGGLALYGHARRRRD